MSSTNNKRRILDKNELGKLQNLETETYGRVSETTVDTYDVSGKAEKRKIDKVSLPSRSA
jgi:hypothetical protein